MNTNVKILLAGSLLVLMSGCRIIQSTDTVYHYAGGVVKDRNNEVIFNYANGFITKYLPISKDKPFKINEDLELYRLTSSCFLYTAWADMGRWGRVGSNGLVVRDKGKALLIDSPTSETQTVELAWWFDKNLDVKFDTFVPGHWHDDCVGGLAWLNRNGVRSIANLQTNRILASQGLEQAQESFSDSLTVSLGKLKAELYFLGGGHATDNIVVWIPSQKILFGGCMIKDLASQNIGNIADAAPLHEWIRTVEKVEQKFPDAQIVIPGHGQAGGKELFKHTIDIIKNELRNNPDY